ncbi:MAG: hypothetical protein CM15mP31_3600 [Gammaproteobacteria bacterium]|nr:MAG: hypothetical protein CM15mP31_3600 [Gammaproteobacteria bacterium]
MNKPRKKPSLKKFFKCIVDSNLIGLNIIRLTFPFLKLDQKNMAEKKLELSLFEAVDDFLPMLA